jgi:signal transduction histidine kinase
MITGRIEDFFLKTILHISFVGTLFIVLMDIFFMTPTDFWSPSGMVDVTILMSICIAIFLHKIGYYTIAVVLTVLLISAALLFISVEHAQSIKTAFVPLNVVGFAISVLLKKRVKYILHALVCMGIVGVMFIHMQALTFYGHATIEDVLTNFASYFIVYLIITYSASALKNKYDAVNAQLNEKNIQLLDQTVAMAHQNALLEESRKELNNINMDLENIVRERTNNVKRKNEYLVKYAFANAHHVRGPLARILGLLQLAKMEKKVDYPFLFEKIEEQSEEIDIVLKKINKDLEEGQNLFLK